MQPEPSRRHFLGLSVVAVGAAACAQTHERPAPSDVESAQTTLARLLAQNRERSPEYRGGLSNHMSMALIALADLGASSARLVEFEGQHAPKLEPFPASGEPVKRDQWRAVIGRKDALSGCVRMFEADVRERGREAVLRDALPALVSGLGGAAFHCMIRTAYAVRVGDDAEVAHGLGYWAARAANLGTIHEPSGAESDPRALLDRVRRDAGFAKRSPGGGSIIEGMRRAAALPGFEAVANALAVNGDTLDRLARAMLDLYASTGDFTALHAVTSTHAFRVLTPFMDEPQLALRYHWQALLAAYIDIGMPDISAAANAAPSTWEEILPRATASEDEHTIKLVDSCREEQRARGGDAYALVAARRAGL